MLSLLTRYLLLHQRLALPGLGSFRLHCRSAEAQVLENRILPPSCEVQLDKEDAVPVHQLQFLAGAAGGQQEAAESLDSLGRSLRNAVRRQRFSWNGIGQLEWRDGIVACEAAPFPVYGLEPVTAHRVIREDARHTRLVGDQQMTAAEASNALLPAVRKRRVELTVGWVLLAISLLAIAYWLYRGGFNPLASGLQLKAD